MTTEMSNELEKLKALFAKAYEVREKAVLDLQNMDVQIKSENADIIKRVGAIQEQWKPELADFNELCAVVKAFGQQRRALEGIEEVQEIMSRLFINAFRKSTTYVVMESEDADKFSRLTLGLPAVVIGAFGMGLRYKIQSQRIRAYEEMRYIVMNAERIAEGLKELKMDDAAEMFMRTMAVLSPMKAVTNGQTPEYAVPFDVPVQLVFPNERMLVLGMKVQLYSRPMLVVEKLVDRKPVDHLSSVQIDVSNPLGLLVYDEVVRGKERQMMRKFIDAHAAAMKPQWDIQRVLEEVRSAGGRWLLLDGV